MKMEKWNRAEESDRNQRKSGTEKESPGVCFCMRVAGMLPERKEVPYPCVPEPGAEKDKAGDFTVVTVSYGFRIPGEDREKTEITPVLYQSCMHPEKIHIDAVQIFSGHGEICFQVRDRQWKIPEQQADIVDIFPWKAELKKKSCIPCTNCGGCSW